MNLQIYCNINKSEKNIYFINKQKLNIALLDLKKKY